MTGKPLNNFQLEILKKLLQIQKLSNHEIAFILECDERTIRRRRYEFAATGNLVKKKDVSKNAEKLKPEYLEKLVEWLKTHDDALLEDCQRFLKDEFGLGCSIPTISRQLRKATGGFRPHGKMRRTARGDAVAAVEAAAPNPVVSAVVPVSADVEPPRLSREDNWARQAAVSSYQQHVSPQLRDDSDGN